MQSMASTRTDAPAGQPALQGEELVAGYTSDIHILQGLSVRAWRGRVACVVGPNGTGKSTLLKTLFGFLRPNSGRVMFEGQDITGTPPYRSIHLGMVYLPQKPSLFPFLSVESNLKLGAWHARLPKSDLRRKLDMVYQQFPVARDKRRQPAGQLSGGQQRQVEIARSLMTNPHLYLIDEPSAGVDPQTSEAIYEMVRNLASEMNKAVLLVDQDVKSALEITDYVYVVKSGRLFAEGPRSDFRGDTDALVAQWLYAHEE